MSSWNESSVRSFCVRFAAPLPWFGLCLAAACVAWLALGSAALAQPAVDATAEAATVDPALVQAALERAGDNRAQLEQALRDVPADERTGLEYLLAYMPADDCRTLTAEYLLQNVALAYRAWREAPWHAQVSEALFLNDVLPYAVINERREDWRSEFLERFRPLVADAKSPGEAAVRLNQQIFGQLGVKYSRQRNRADQGPRESIETGLASCTGLSILLIDACRAVGVPARFAGTPLWADGSGNHSWVEVWDDGWRFTGAAEPAGDELDQGWFTARAAQAQADDRLRAIYATSYRPTSLHFPLVWDRNNQSVHAVNVTARYANPGEKLPEGQVRLMVRALGPVGDRRRAADFTVRDAQGQQVHAGVTKDERYDGNDHAVAIVPQGAEYVVVGVAGDEEVVERVTADREGVLVSLRFQAAVADAPAASVNGSASSDDEEAGERAERAQRSTGGRRAVRQLRRALEQIDASWPDLSEAEYAAAPLTRRAARQAQEALVTARREFVRRTRAAEMQRESIRFADSGLDGEAEMKFAFRVSGDAPPEGRSLYISMHGGGGAPPRVNDQQWENQKKLYEPEEGVYVAPRAPTDTWDLWHQGHIDPLFTRLIENFVVFHDVNPRRVYLMGYSAGGDGVYQLAPRMADQLAAAAMMAGHPNETQPQGLRNLPFALYMGGRDAAYRRNEIAAEWGDKLAALRTADPQGYLHLVQIYPDKGHWMDREDASAVPWMSQFERQLTPDRVVWRQDDVLHQRFYWLRVASEQTQAGTEIVARREGQTFVIERCDVDAVTLLLNDDLVNLDEPVTVRWGDQTVFEGVVPRTIATLAQTLAERGDPTAMFSASVTVLRP
jgi:dienelactone hydrolase